MNRNPIVDPQPGDVISQPSGHLVKVTRRDGERVEWVAKTPRGKEWKFPNAWTLRGWTRNVCDRAKVVEATNQ